MRHVPRLVAVSALFSAVTALSLASALTAASAATSGVMKVWASPQQSGPSPIVITGVISDYGTAVTTDRSGTPNPNGNFELLTLKHGTIDVNSTAFNQKTNSTAPQFDATTCSFDQAVTGNVTIDHGTGSYSGIHGTLLLTEQFAGIGPRLKNGDCNSSNSAQPVAFWGAVTGHGTVTFGS